MYNPIMSTVNLPSILSTAQTGMNRGLARLDHAAATIAQGKVDAPAFVDLLVAEQEVAQNAEVVRTAEGIHKSLLDILA